MHWLQALDTSLFYFVNRTLSNPFFDWLMPLLSNNVFFFPLVLLLGLGLLWKGGVRMRLCVVMLAVILPLGDNLVINTVKHAVARQRPYATLPEARLFGSVGKGYIAPETGGNGPEMANNQGSGTSMPSSHASSWFAATLIFFIYCRRSAWFMLPMALAVSYSRVYNGVHYPGDVLAGAILGGGYAAALAITFEAAWQWLGKKWFPLWHAQLPSLLNPVHSPQSTVISPSAFAGFQRDEQSKVQSPEAQVEIKSEIGNRKSEIEWLRLGYILIFAMLIGRWIYIASGTIDLEKDEAYQWLWSKHMALSYFSKPLGIALIQFVSTSLFGDTQFGVRFFSPLFAAILSVVLLRFMAREAGAKPAFCLLLVATATLLLGIGTILMTIDPPLVLCWMWALVAGWRAVAATPSPQTVEATPPSPPSDDDFEQRGRCRPHSCDEASQPPGGRTRDWLVVGLAMGLGFLCKYTAACQIACWAIFFALWPPARAHLRRPGPWLALLIFLICTLPVVIWNSQHGWITVHHVAGDASLDKQWHPTLRFFWDFLFTQAGLLNPIFFAGALWAMFGFWKRWRERPLWLYLFCMGAPVFFGYWLYSFHSRILPNWPVTAVLPLFCLMVLYWNERPRIARPFLAVGLVLGFFAVVTMYQSDLIGKVFGGPLPGEKDPSRRVRAWKPTAAFVETEREKLEAEGKPAFIIADHYGMTGLFSFYLPQAHAALKTNHLVYCVDSNEPVNQFYFWPDYNYRSNRHGQNAIFVSELDPYPLESGWLWKWLVREPVNYAAVPPPMQLPERIAGEFESVTDLGEHEIKYGDRVFRRLHLWACYDLK